MPRKKPTFTISDLKRAVTGARDLGIKVGSFSIGPDGSIRVYEAVETAPSPESAYEAWKRGNAS